MSDRLTATLWNPQQGHGAIQQAWAHAKAMLMAGHRLTLEIKPEKRNLPQNARLHARLTEIASRHEWAGQRRDVEVWKRLLTAAWLRARGESVEILPAVDGHGVDVVFRRTSDLTKAECCELMEFIDAWEASL